MTAAPPPRAALLAFLLAVQPGRTQREYADALELTQARISQLAEQLRRTEGNDRDRLLRRWRSGRPGPSGLVQHWYGLSDPWAQALSAYRVLEGHGAQPVLGGEAAAQVLDAWRAPGRALLYADRLVPLSPVGLVPTDDLAEATLTLVLTDDPTVAATARTLGVDGAAVRVTHPLVAAADLTLGTSDTDDDRLREQRERLEILGGVSHGAHRHPVHRAR